MEVKFVSKEVIRPSSPTIKTYNLSFLDQQFYGAVYNKLFFFYQNRDCLANEDMNSDKIRCLKASLSEVLTNYYPLAGKTKDKYSVYTGEDDGAEFIEARVNGTLSEYLIEPEVNLFLAHLVSDDYYESPTRPLLAIQASFFTCGGLAIGINISHRVADAASFTCFINSWAVTAMGIFNKFLKKPDFSGSLVFPPSDQFVGTEGLQDILLKPILVTRRFLFSVSHIIGLQKKATKLGTRPPSRVQTISAFLWKIGMKMLLSRSGGSQIPSALTMPINLRSILPRPICDQSFGNLFEAFTVYNGYNHSGNKELSYLTSLISEKIEELRKTFQNKIYQGETSFIECLASTTEKEELAFKQHNFLISSWCRFPFYDADFGWGKPTWVANYNRAPNCIGLMDTSDGTGIEVWASFAEDDMAVFASDEELLVYATLDPNVD